MARLTILFCVLLQHITLSSCYRDSNEKRSFTIDYINNQFLKDGQPFRYISGGMHYFRVPHEYWDDRLYKMRKGGMNAVQTYVAWNVHEPFKGDYRFSGNNDIVKFIETAQKNDLLVILRPGPYICAEWEYGGFPYWIMKEVSPTQLRTRSDVYLKIVEKWMSVLLTKLRPLLYENGGPIISVQVENEYGSYGNDHVYMRKLETVFRKHLGNDVILFTTDGAGDWFLKRGALPSLYTTVDFGAGGDVEKYFAIQRKYQPQGPYINSEYYTGWLDHWGEKHSRVSGLRVAKTLDTMLARNASVNLYMFIGGTNFGFMNGANFAKRLQPQPTSYDYDSPLTEAGDPTEKYFLIQKTVSKYQRIPPGPSPKPTEKASYGTIKATQTLSIYSILDHFQPVESENPLSFEEMDIPYGYVLYRTSIQHVLKGEAILDMKKMHDRAVVLVDGQTQGIVYAHNSTTLKISEGGTLDILVENQGRVNYGGMMRDTGKGILKDVTVNGNVLKNWKMYAINDTVLLSTPSTKHSLWSLYKEEDLSLDVTEAPCVTRFSFDVVGDPQDTFLKLDAWNKGVVFINGFNLGRYWTPAGPQGTLYVPKYLLKKRNILVVFETDAVPASLNERVVESVDAPVWTK